MPRAPPAFERSFESSTSGAPTPAAYVLYVTYFPSGFGIDPAESMITASKITASTGSKDGGNMALLAPF
jgi:hypothetical protein